MNNFKQQSIIVFFSFKHISGGVRAALVFFMFLSWCSRFWLTSFCTYHIILFPSAYCQSCAESRSTRFFVSSPFAEVVTSRGGGRTVRFASEIGPDNVAPALPMIGNLEFRQSYLFYGFTCAWSCRFSIWPGSFKPRVSERNSTIAFRQANSAGSTNTDLKRQRVSWRYRISIAVCFDWPAVGCALLLDGFIEFVLLLLLFRCCVCSAAEKTAQFAGSSGMHHWIALSRKSSDQDSSSKITYMS